MSALTYVLQIDGPGLLCKFGRTKNPTSRVNTLKTGLPWPLRTVALIGSDIESELKKQFAEDRVQGEWFNPSPRLREWLEQAAVDGRLVKQTPVDQRYINAVIKPRIREYLGGREPANNPSGDLIRCIFADVIPSLKGRERDLHVATKGHVTEFLSRGFGPVNDVPDLRLPEALSVAQDAAA